MRIMIFYDLPFGTKINVHDYNNFRNGLIKEGFSMIQYSIYTKICPNEQAARFIEDRVEKIVPKHGNIRMMTVTEKQYQKIKVLRGKKTEQELIINDRRYIEI